MDGTHVPCIVDAHLQPAFRNRKGYTSQNVLAIVDFQMKFTYVVVGWKGSVHDARVLRDAERDPSFRFPHPPMGKCNCICDVIKFYFLLLLTRGCLNCREILFGRLGFRQSSWFFGTLPRDKLSY